MKKIIPLLLILLLSSYVYADINKKVRTKDIEIINTKVRTKDVQVINRKVQTKDIEVPEQKTSAEPTIIEPNAVPEQQTVYIEEETPVAPPLYTPAEEPTNMARTPEKAKDQASLSEKPAMQVGARLGATAPGTGLAIDLTFLPIDMGNNNTMYTRIGLVSEQDSKHSLLALHINEHYHVPLGGTFEGYGGLGLNMPLSKGNADKTGMGMNFILGIEDNIDFLADKTEKIFLETGINSISINDKSKSAFNLLGGYKIVF